MKTLEWSPFGIALAVILVVIVILAARKQIAAAIKRLWTATLGAFFEPKEYSTPLPEIKDDAPEGSPNGWYPKGSKPIPAQKSFPDADREVKDA